MDGLRCFFNLARKKTNRAELERGNGDRGGSGLTGGAPDGEGGGEVLGGRGWSRGSRFCGRRTSGPCVQRRASPGGFGLHVLSTAAPATACPISTSTKAPLRLLHQILPPSSLLSLFSTTSTFLLLLCLFFFSSFLL